MPSRTFLYITIVGDKMEVQMISFHNTIQKYLLLLQSVFNNLKISHEDHNGNLITKSVPVVLRSREKMKVLDNYTEQQLLSGNTNVLPCAYLSLEVMSVAPDRLTNKNQNYVYKKHGSKVQYSFNSLAYDYNITLSVKARGYTDIFQIIEQVAVLFNPTLNLDCWDSLGTDEPTRIPVTCDGFDIVADEYEETSTNVVTVNFSLTLHGWLYQPVYTDSAVDNVLINTGSTKDWVHVELQERVPSPVIDKLVPDYNYTKGDDVELHVLCHADRRSRLTYTWECSDNVSTDVNPDDVSRCVVHTSEHDPQDSFAIAVTIRDQFNNEVSVAKVVKCRTVLQKNL